MKYLTKHLECEHGGVTIIQADSDNIDCGRISPAGRRTTCLWPMSLGPEPNWFEPEVDSLMEQIQDAFTFMMNEDNYPSTKKEKLR